MQGANASVTGIANLFGPALFTEAFAVAIGGGHVPASGAQEFGDARQAYPLTG